MGLSIGSIFYAGLPSPVFAFRHTGFLAGTVISESPCASQVAAYLFHVRIPSGLNFKGR